MMIVQPTCIYIELFAIVQYIIVAAEEMQGDTSLMYYPSWMINRDCASMPLSIQEPTPSYSSDAHKD
jgi:hypothetical protein